MAMLDSVSREPAIRKAVGAKSPMELFGLVRSDAFPRLTDSELLDFGQVFVTTLSHADSADCAGMWLKGFAAGFPALGVHITAADAPGWARWEANMVRASILNHPIGPLADSAEVHNTLLSAVTSAAGRDKESFTRAFRRQGGAAETCRFMIATYAQLFRFPRDQAARVFRATMYKQP